MTVEELAMLINKVCGLAINWSKACIYYCMATQKIRNLNWMPVLEIVAPKGSGKSRLIDILRRLCNKAYDICCHDTMTKTSLRNELTKARDRTAVIEEGDLYPRRKELESYLISRVDRNRTSNVPVTQQVNSKDGVAIWVTEKPNVFGATIIHDRHEMVDMAAERRSITINIKQQKGKLFLKPDKACLKALKLPDVSLGEVPDYFTMEGTGISGAALDTWEPLIKVAAGLGDDDWLMWALDKVIEMSDSLADSQQFELEQVIFGALVQGYDGIGVVEGLNATKIAQSRLPLTVVVDIVRKQSQYFDIQAKTIGTQLRKMGFNNIRPVGGRNKILTTLDEIKNIAKEIGYQDDSL